MIQGFMSGMNRLDKAAKYSALVPKAEHQEWVKLEHQFFHETQTIQAFEWADIVIDLGSILIGFDQRRFNYISSCRKLDKPYMYGATYFMAPDPRITKDIPAVATGPSSALFFEGATGKLPVIGACVSFLVEPKEWAPNKEGKDYVRSFTTHIAHPYDRMTLQGPGAGRNDVQLILRRDKNNEILEPKLPEIKRVCLKPRVLFGLVQTLEEIHTCRYHLAVPAVLYERPLFSYNRNKARFRELEEQRGKTWPEIKELAMKTCNLAWELVGGT
jgi:hypothetical protein